MEQRERYHATQRAKYRSDPEYRAHRKKIAAAWYAKNKELTAERAKAWISENRERHNEFNRASKAKNPARGRMATQDYEALVATQENLCAACGKPEWTRSRNGRVRRLCLDHDHKTGNVRGLLCNPCNSALGYVDDSPELLEKLAAYLRQHKLHLVTE